MIPPDISRENILDALTEIDKTGEPADRESKIYSLIYKNKQYSPKYVLSIATKLKTGKGLESSDFHANQARSFLIDLNFPVVDKNALDATIEILRDTHPNRERYKEMSTIIAARDEVYAQYRTIFNPDTIDNLTKDEIEGFLDFKNNKHWTGLSRTKKGYINNISGLKKILTVFLDEKVPIAERFEKIGKISEEELIKGLGKGTLTAILHIAYPDRYGIWNTTTEDGLKKSNVWPTFRSKATEGEKYDVLNEILNFLADQSQVDLWTLDALWWKLDTPNTLAVRYWQIAPGKNAAEWNFWKEKEIVAIYFSEITENTGPDIINMSYDEISEVFREVYPESAAGSPGPRQISNFINEIKPGDRVVINHGKKTILAYGKIESEPTFDEAGKNKIIRTVIWEEVNLNNIIPESLKGKFGKTLTEISEEEYNLLTGSKQNYWAILPSDGTGKPGTEIIYWDLWRDKGVVTTSFWKDFIAHHKESLLHFTEKEYQTAFRDFYQNKEQSDMIWKFINQIKIGDTIILNRGKRTIFAVGEVESDPYLDDSGDTLARKIKWTTLTSKKPIPEVIKNKFSRWIINLKSEEYNQIFQSEPLSDEYQRLDRLLIKKGQVILYGPPGTGKTYHSSKYIDSKIKTLPKIIDKPLQINKNFYWFSINPGMWDPENLWKEEEVDLWYGNHKQAFSEIEESDIVFCYVSGVEYHRFTGIATCVKKTYSSEGIPQVFLKGIRKVDGPDWKTLKSDGILSASLPVRTGARGTLFSLTTEEGLRILSMQEISPADLDVEEETGIVENFPKNVVTFHSSFSYEEFIEGIMPSVGIDGKIQYQVKEGIFKSICRTAFNSLLHYLSIDKTWNADSDIPNLTPEEREQVNTCSSELPYFLVIDEINRGDISRIFGELITLLEKDKRATGLNELSVILPYSRTRFAIPPNLFIIGTMNTADKSIALVDVALRRRFGFIEMIPNQTVLEEYLSHDSLEIQKIFSLASDLLKEINSRIIQEFDRDHQIGHSYLMRLKGCSSREEAVSELWSIWYDEMMPLLQEYFYDAPTRLHAVVGDEFVEYNTHSLIIYPEKDEEEFLMALQNILETKSE